MISNSSHIQIGTVPRPALLLGLAGLIPFIGATLALLASTGETGTIWRAALLGYSVAILSFMGGVQWGLAMRAQTGDREWLRYSVSVVPALLGWLALLLPTPAQFPLLAAGFAALLFYDIGTVHRGEAPSWYRNLRWPLTVVVVACLALASTFGLTP